MFTGEPPDIGTIAPDITCQAKRTRWLSQPFRGRCANCLSVTGNLQFQELFLFLCPYVIARAAADPSVFPDISGKTDPQLTPCYMGEYCSHLCATVYVLSGFYLSRNQAPWQRCWFFQPPCDQQHLHFLWMQGSGFLKTKVECYTFYNTRDLQIWTGPADPGTYCRHTEHTNPDIVAQAWEAAGVLALWHVSLVWLLSHTNVSSAPY